MCQSELIQILKHPQPFGHAMSVPYLPNYTLQQLHMDLMRSYIQVNIWVHFFLSFK